MFYPLDYDWLKLRWSGKTWTYLTCKSWHVFCNPSTKWSQKSIYHITFNLWGLEQFKTTSLL